VDCKAIKENVNTSEVVLENRTEQLIESEILLPEYCNEIMQILKCVPTVKIMSKQVTVNKVLIDGYVSFKIIYLSPENDFINCFEQNIPFNKNIELQRDYENHIVDVDCDIDYLNCRAVNERRIDLRSSLSILTKVCFMKVIDVSSKIDEPTIQQYNQCKKHISTIALKEKNFTINEMLNIDSENVNDIVIIKTEENINITDYKCITNKCIIKGDVQMKICYMDSRYAKEIKEFNQSIAINQIVDINGVDEDCKCSITTKILSCVFDKTSNDDVIKYMVNIYGSIMTKVYKDEDIKFIKDIYSTKHNIEYNKKAIELDDLSSKRDVKISKDIEIPNFFNSCEEIIDLSVNLKKSRTTLKDECVNFAFVTEISCIYMSKNGAIECSTKESEISHSECAIDDVVPNDCTIVVTNINKRYNQDDGTLNLHIDVSCDINLVSKKEVEVIDVVNMDTEQEKEYEKNSALTIYYADRGENLWEIAKKYNTCIDEILKQNNIETENLKERTMILIPIVR